MIDVKQIAEVLQTVHFDREETERYLQNVLSEMVDNVLDSNDAHSLCMDDRDDRERMRALLLGERKPKKQQPEPDLLLTDPEDKVYSWCGCRLEFTLRGTGHIPAFFYCDAHRKLVDELEEAPICEECGAKDPGPESRGGGMTAYWHRDHCSLHPNNLVGDNKP